MAVEMTREKFDALWPGFLSAYLATASWADGEIVNPEEEPTEFSPSEVAVTSEMLTGLIDFLAEVYSHFGAEFHLSTNGQGMQWLAHNFWLTRNGHGAGFWDTTHPQKDLLTTIAKTQGSAYFSRSRDGKMYHS